MRIRFLSVRTVMCAGLAAVLLAFGFSPESLPARGRPTGQAAQAPSAENELERLMQLPASAASTDARSRSANDWLTRCREQIQAARSYRSWLIKRDFSLAHLAPRNFAYVEWRLGALRPGRLQVQQVIHEQAPLGDLREERIAISSEYFINFGKWMRADSQSATDFAELDRFLLLDKFAEILRGKFNVVGTVVSGDRRYALLENENARVGNFQVISDLKDAKCLARLWIEEESGLLAKAELTFQGKDAEGAPVRKSFEQVFAAYNSDLAIEPPTLPNR